MQVYDHLTFNIDVLKGQILAYDPQNFNLGIAKQSGLVPLLLAPIWLLFPYLQVPLHFCVQLSAALAQSACCCTCIICFVALLHHVDSLLSTHQAAICNCKPFNLQAMQYVLRDVFTLLTSVHLYSCLPLYVRCYVGARVYVVDFRGCSRAQR